MMLTADLQCLKDIFNYFIRLYSSAAVRRINDKLIQLERQFIDPHGLPNRRDYKYEFELINKPVYLISIKFTFFNL